jgi:hypothetical protein
MDKDLEGIEVISQHLPKYKPTTCKIQAQTVVAGPTLSGVLKFDHAAKRKWTQN